MEHNTGVGFNPDSRFRFWADEPNPLRIGKIAPQNVENYTKNGMSSKRSVSKGNRANAEMFVRGILAARACRNLPSRIIFSDHPAEVRDS
jgi:hypothetical protein